MPCSTPFSVLRRSFELLAREPGDPVLDVADVPGAPQQTVGAAELGRWLPHASSETADEVWRRMITRMRGGDAAWTVVAAGLALPGLYGARRPLRHGLGDEVADLEAEMLTALVAQMRAMALEPAAVCGRLLYAARKAGMRYRYALDRSRRRERHREPTATEAVAASARGPVTVLAEAIKGGVVSALEAELIARTYLEGRPLNRVAQELGLSYITARRHRRDAQARLVRAVAGEKAAA
ncbi:hypothetical protein HDA32_005117 [Spinactinospora alkalitolerans]|uniref:Uncharacterized protein n=1 Tax=Spinactinospora alkalitolerans TaxID=687207 RepID=A0A852U325_9ACTN|nr:hypothetical protein [Spinactinospora alkalitolerans]NYE49997.1 hypothetical protein [Spinactinospora alkalitolerans]